MLFRVCVLAGCSRNWETSNQSFNTIFSKTICAFTLAILVLTCKLSISSLIQAAYKTIARTYAENLSEIQKLGASVVAHQVKLLPASHEHLPHFQTSEAGREQKVAQGLRPLPFTWLE